MTRLLITALTIYAVGCVIPAPLEAETTPTIGQPVIVSGQAPKEFGPVSITPQLMTYFKFSFTATDANLDDVLYATLFYVDGDPENSYYRALQGAQLMAAVPGDPTTRTVDFTPLPYCCFLSNPCTAPQIDQLVYAFVSTDSTPVVPNHGPPMFRGPIDRQYWTISCQ